jgi:hypothetical protein
MAEVAASAREARWAKPESRISQSAVMSRVNASQDQDKRKKNAAEALRRKWEDPEYRAKMSKAIAESNRCR